MLHPKIRAEKAAIVVALAFTTACTSYHLPTMSDKNLLVQQQQKNYYSDLTQILRSVPWVRVSGSLSSATILVTRNVQFSTAGPPLFVVNGIETGTIYEAVYYMVQAKDVKNISVMSDVDALSTYGSRGKNGAIIIQTFQDFD